MKNWFPLAALLALLVACEKNKAPENYDGLWQIKHVENEDKQQEPYARWMEVKNDRYTWGDGEFIVDSGAWVLDESLGIALLDSDAGADGDTEWYLSNSNDSLIFKGTENKSNSYKVKMIAVKVGEKPLSYIQKLTQKWKIETVFKDSIPQPKRADAWIEFKSDNTWETAGESGVWSVNPYVPIVDVKSEQGEVINEWFMIFKPDSMYWIGTSTYGNDGLEVQLTKWKE